MSQLSRSRLGVVASFTQPPGRTGSFSLDAYQRRTRRPRRPSARHAAEDEDDHRVHDALDRRELGRRVARVAHDLGVVADVHDEPDRPPRVAQRRAAQQRCAMSSATSRDGSAPPTSRSVPAKVWMRAFGGSNSHSTRGPAQKSSFARQPPPTAAVGATALILRLVSPSRFDVSISACPPSASADASSTRSAGSSWRSRTSTRSPTRRSRHATATVSPHARPATRRHVRAPHVVRLAVRAVALEVLRALLRHRERDDERERADRRVRVDRRV